MNRLYLRPFQRSDFPVYRRWFEDPWLNRALGPIDEEWLETVLNETDGAQYAVLKDKELVAVTGLKWGDPEHPYQVVTDLAVAPHRRRCGIGRQTLTALFLQAGPFNYDRWIAYVSPDNLGARQFLTRLGWSVSPRLKMENEWSIYEIQISNP